MDAPRGARVAACVDKLVAVPVSVALALPRNLVISADETRRPAATQRTRQRLEFRFAALALTTALSLSGESASLRVIKKHSTVGLMPPRSSMAARLSPDAALRVDGLHPQLRPQLPEESCMPVSAAGSDVVSRLGAGLSPQKRRRRLSPPFSSPGADETTPSSPGVWQHVSPNLGGVIFRYVAERDFSATRLVCKAWARGLNETVQELRPTSDCLPAPGWPQRFPCVQELDLSLFSGARLSNLLSDIAQNPPPRLERLRLAPHTADEDLEFLDRLPSVTCLDLAACELLTGDKLAELFARGCFPRLISLDLDISHLQRLSGAAAAVLEHLPPTLAHLDVGSWPSRPGGPDVVRGLSWPKSLKRLVLRQDAVIDDEELLRLQSMPELTSLTLSGCRGVSDAGLARFFSSASTCISTLDLTGCEAVGRHTIAVIADRLRSLTHLDLSSCSNISRGDLDGHIQKLKQLNSLSLSYTDIGDQDVAAVGELLRLESLNLSGCTCITSRGMHTLRSLRSLSVLRLNGCSQLSHGSMLTISRLTSLASLEMAHCPMVTDQGLSLLLGLSNLRSLNLAGCRGADNNLLTVMRALTRLTSLNLSECERITDAGLSVTLRHNKDLRYLGLAHCHGISDTWMDKLKDMPHIILAPMEFAA